MIIYGFLRSLDIFFVNSKIVAKSLYFYFLKDFTQFHREVSKARLLNLQFIFRQIYKLTCRSNFWSVIRDQDLSDYLLSIGMTDNCMCEVNRKSTRAAIGKNWENFQMKGTRPSECLKELLKERKFVEIGIQNFGTPQKRETFWEVQPPKLVSSDLFRNHMGRRRRVLRAKDFGVQRLKYVTAVSGSNVFLSEGGAYVDEYRPDYPRDCDPKNEPFLRGVFSNSVLIDQEYLDSLDSVAVEECHWLSGPMFNEWGHFINTYLTKIVEIVDSENLFEQPIYVPENATEQQMSFLRKLAPNSTISRTNSSIKYIVKELFYFPSTVYSPTNVRLYRHRLQSNVYVDPLQFRKMHNLIDRTIQLEDNLDCKKVLWLRRGFSRRILVNQDEFEKLVLGCGYQPFNALQHSIEEQLEILTYAESICGEVGSWIYLLGRNPNCKVTLIMSDWDQHWWNEIGSLNQLLIHPIQCVIGSRTTREDYQSENGPSSEYTISLRSLSTLRRTL